MDYTIGHMADVSGVTIRTLHYYDEIGLLKPCYVSEAGYRFYSKQQLLLLQQILFYKELGFELKQIHRIINAPDFDLLRALHNHKKTLHQTLAHTHTLMHTLDKTIEHLERHQIMKEQEMFWGFSKEKQQEYESQLVERYGDEMQQHINESYQNIKHFKKEDWQRVKSQADDINKRLLLAMQSGLPVDAGKVQDIIKEHYQWICAFWTPNAQSYAGLGQLYLQSPDFKKMYDAYHTDLAQYVADAMALFAQTNL